ncbi:SPOR domain-containing protein, partial [Ideonella livida]
SAPPLPASAPARAASRAPAASPAPVASSPARASGRDPLAILEGGPVITEATKPAPKPTEPVAAGFYVQAGAYSSGADAEQQRARLAMQGFSSKVVEREQNGRSVYRVRLGPYGSREDAQQAQDRLKSAGFDAILSSDRPKP